MNHFDEEPVVAFFPDRLGKGKAFSKWPLHLTIVPPAHVEVEKVYGAVHSSIGDTIGQIEIGESDMFGESGDTLVYHVHPELELRRLHRDILARLGGATVLRSMESEWVGDNYSPHITPKPDQGIVMTGEVYVFDNLTIVGRDQASGLRVIRSVIDMAMPYEDN